MSRSQEHDARNNSLREEFSSTTGARAASEPTAKVVLAQCRERRLPLQSEDIPDSDGAVLHWIGDPTANSVLLYFHGGGFGLSAFPGHVLFLASCMEKAAVHGRKVVTAMLEYGLTPTKKYPTQYVQAVRALRHVLKTGYAPSDIVVGGDSAGGNMVLALISCLIHPHPAMPALKLTKPLKGALLICPWASFSPHLESHKLNRERDIHSSATMEQWAADFASLEERNNYSEPFRADAKWWKDAPVDRILLLWGEYELFRDEDKKVANTLTEAGLEVQPVECARQVHIDCVLDAQTGMEPGPMSEAAWEWLSTVY